MAEPYHPRWLQSGGEFTPQTHDAAMQTIVNASGESLLSYEEAIAVYLRERGILRDDAAVLADPIPAGWEPPQPLEGEVKRLALRPGDRVVLSFTETLSREAVERFREVWMASFPPQEAPPLIVLDRGITMSVLGPEPANG
jgi:hypothetical protein